MGNRVTRLVAGAALFAVLAMGAAGCGETKGPVATIYLSVEQSEPLTERGNDMQKAVELAIEQSGGVEGGRTIELVVPEFTCPPNAQCVEPARYVADKAANDDRSLAVIAAPSFTQTLAANIVTRTAGLLQVSPGPGLGLDTERFGELLPPNLNRRARSEWLRAPQNLIYVAPSQYVTGQAVVQAAAGNGARSLETSAVPKAMRQGMIDEADRRDIKLTDAAKNGSRGTSCNESELTIEGQSDPGDPAHAHGYCRDGGTVVATPRSNGRQLITPALAPDDLPPAGQRFYDDFEAKYGHYPDRLAIYAYEAAGLVLQAIKDAEENSGKTTRQSVREAAFAIRNRFGPVGHYDVLPSGETTLTTIAIRKLPLPEDPTEQREPADDSVVEVTR